jgi:hypothetical protein
LTKVIFTICSNNYLGQATVLGTSVRAHHPEATFMIILADKKSSEIDYSQIPFEVLPMEAFEPRTEELATRYNIIEFNTCVKPRVFEYLFSERGIDRAFYIDPDIRVYSPLTEVDAALEHSSAALTPHILTAMPCDGQIPDERAFLRLGMFNLGFIGLRNTPETLAIARWWKERTYEAGYINPDSGMFVDQLWANYLPIYLQDAALVRHEGYNMAPWNLHERRLSRTDGVFFVNDDKPLAFFHFSSFRVDSGELPRQYNRVSMKDRPDLVDLYAEYNEALKTAGHATYSRIRWVYRPAPADPGPIDILRKKVRRSVGRGLMWSVRRLPDSFRERAYLIFRDTRE